MKIIDTETTRRALSFDRLIPALRDMFMTGCEVPPRHTHTLAAPNGTAAGTILVMPAWQPGAYLGIKTVNIFPGNASRGLPGLFSTYILYDAQTGEPLAQIDGNEITSRRTAAASALAASYLAPQQPASLLVVGSGQVASVIPEAYRAVLPIKEIMVWARAFDNAQALVGRLRAQNIDAVAVTDLAAAAARADIVSCATLATAPVVHGAWLNAASHLDLIGSFTPAMREADDDAFRGGARLYVDTSEALQKSGELLGPISRGVISAGDVVGTLEDLARGTTLGRIDNGSRTVFKSVGTALEDLAAAVLVWKEVCAS